MGLRAFHPALAREAARADDDEGLQNVEALAERVRGRIEKRQHALTLVVVHQAPDDGHRQDKDAREGNKDALAQACEEDDGCARDEHEDRGAEVGLLHDEADGDGHDDEGRQMVPVADVLPSDVVVPGEHHGDRKLHELRGLDAHADVEPAGGALDGHAEEMRQKQQHTADDEDRNGRLLEGLHGNAGHDEHDDACDGDVANLSLDAPREAVAGGEERDEADRRQRDDEGEQHQVDAQQTRCKVPQERVAGSGNGFNHFKIAPQRLRRWVMRGTPFGGGSSSEFAPVSQ